jgi:hypothetical protein
MGHRKKGRDISHLYDDAVSHPVRLLILKFVIKKGTASPVQASRSLGENLPRIAYHTRVLVDFGVIELVSTRSVRGAIEHNYKPVQSALEHPILRAALSRGPSPDDG